MFDCSHEKLGWVRLYREIIDRPVFKSPELLKVYIWCNLKANHKMKWVPVSTGIGETIVQVERGQFIFGRKKAAAELNMKESSVRNRMEKLEKLGYITRQPDTHFSVVTIVDWDIDQFPSTEKDRQKDRQKPTKGQSKDTNNNDKNEENEKKIFSIIDYFNTVTNSSLRKTTPKYHSLINNILEYNYTEKDIKLVIDYFVKKYKKTKEYDKLKLSYILNPDYFDENLNEARKLLPEIEWSQVWDTDLVNHKRVESSDIVGFVEISGASGELPIKELRSGNYPKEQYRNIMKAKIRRYIMDESLEFSKENWATALKFIEKRGF